MPRYPYTPESNEPLEDFNDYEAQQDYADMTADDERDDYLMKEQEESKLKENEQ